MCYFSQCVILQGNYRMLGRNIDKSKVEVWAGAEHFFLCHLKVLCCNLVLYEIWRCFKSPSFIDAKKVFVSICFHLGMWIMLLDFWWNYNRIILLFKRFETWVLCLLWATIWEGKTNITHWWWTQLGISEFKMY
jgi:hypothetical protein